MTAQEMVMELCEEVNEHRYKKGCAAFFLDKLEDKIEDYGKQKVSQALEDIKKEVKMMGGYLEQRHKSKPDPLMEVVEKKDVLLIIDKYIK